jgi:hypothetical protein
MDRWIPNARQQAAAGSIHQIKSVRISLDREMQQHEEAGYEWRGDAMQVNRSVCLLHGDDG